VSVLLATGALAEILGVQPWDFTASGGTFDSGGSGVGTRSDEIVGMKKEKPEPVTQQALEQNAEKTHGGGAAIAAENLKEKGMNKSKKGMKSKHRGTASASDAGNGDPKKDPQMFQQQNSDTTAQGQQLINKQPMEKQQPASRSARGGSPN
jgi:hypothetical protein